jgi:cyclic-di-GMP phosphodiesterase TipF (flagellum assembly factor)
MVRIGAIFITLCMMLIAGSAGTVAYLRFGFTGAESALVAGALFAVLAVYNTLAARVRHRDEASEQMSMLSRSSGDLARQLGEFGRRLNAMETRVEQVLERSLATAQPLTAELEELSTLVKQLADSVAAHDLALGDVGARGRAAELAPVAGVANKPAVAVAVPAPAPAPVESDVRTAPAPAPVQHAIAAFAGLDRDGIIALVRNAVETARIDLYLQPIVTLPQRKVRYYEALSRLKADDGEPLAAGDFLQYAEAGSLMPKLDQLTVLRCVQVVRRLLLKNREVGLFCNLSGATLTDFGFPQLLEFVEANRAIAPSLVFEFSQSAVRAMGPIEHESLAALADRGFRFSMDNVADLHVEPRELTDRGFRFVKVPAALLFNRRGAASTDIHPADFSDLLGRFGIDLIADRIESESTVIDLLDYDVRFGQGFLFAPPRPVRAEALKSNGEAAVPAGKSEAAKPHGATLAPNAGAAGEAAAARGALGQLVAAAGRG